MNTRQEGFTIVEVVVSMVLLGIILTALAGLTYTTARVAVLNTDASTLQAASLEVVNRYTALPYASLPVGTSCTTVGAQNNQFERCVTIASSGPGARDVTVVTRALQRTRVPPTTVRFTRVAPPVGNPLCVGC